VQIKLIVRLEQFATCMAYKWLGYPSPGVALSPLSVVGPMLEADILVIAHLGAVLNLSVTVGVLGRIWAFYDKIGYHIRLLCCICFSTE
jgi:hypothetical protein